jgi:hypothetical protein
MSQDGIRMPTAGGFCPLHGSFPFLTWKPRPDRSVSIPLWRNFNNTHSFVTRLSSQRWMWYGVGENAISNSNFVLDIFNNTRECKAASLDPLLRNAKLTCPTFCDIFPSCVVPHTFHMTCFPSILLSSGREGHFPWGLSRRAVTLTSRLHLVPRSRILELYASVMVNVLCCKPEGRGFETRWGNFFQFN